VVAQLAGLLGSWNGSQGPFDRFCGRHVRGAVEQRLAAQALADVAGLADGQRGGGGIPQAGEIPGVIE
jgi:hypothetical protein